MRSVLGVMILGLAALAGVLPAEAQTRKYVDDSATGTNNGSSWVNAYTDLQSALAAPGVTEIWVAAGAYKPGVLRSDTFSVTAGILLYGGFRGHEPNQPDEDDLSDRNEFLNETILDGNIGNTSVNTDNSYHVVSFVDTGYSNTGTKLSGFTIQNGNADDPNDPFDPNDPTPPAPPDESNGCGGGIYFGGPRGGAGPALDRLILRNNRAHFEGGGIFNGTKQNVFLTNCRFEGNRVTGNDGRGGAIGMVKKGGGIFQNCVFYDNQCTGTDSLGGAISNVNSDGAIAVTSCTFSANSCTGKVVSSVQRYGHCMYVNRNLLAVRNLVSWGNGSGGQAQFDGTGTYGVVWSNIQMGTWTADDDNIYPALDPLFRDPSNDNLTLLPCSPCVDAGRRLLHTFQNVWIWYIERDQTDLNENGDFGEEEEADTELTPWDAANHHRLIVYRGNPADPNDALDMGGTESCPGDFTGDGLVGLSDLANLLAIFGSPQGTYPRGDVDLPDLAVLLTHWGE